MNKNRIGMCQWFHFKEYERAQRAVSHLEDLGVKHLRMDVSWADYFRSDGPEWYNWLFKMLGTKFKLLVCLWHTPPSISRNGKPNGPPFPSKLAYFQDLVRQVIEQYGEYIEAVELWNEPNNRLKWDFSTFDPHWSWLDEMILRGAKQAKTMGMTTVFGGISPINGGFLRQFQKSLSFIDIIGIHAFPGQWNEASGWQGWTGVERHILQAAGGRRVWVTESGLAAKPDKSDELKLQRKQFEETIDTAYLLAHPLQSKFQMVVTLVILNALTIILLSFAFK